MEWAEAANTLYQRPETQSLHWEAQQLQHRSEATSLLYTGKWVPRAAWVSWEISVVD